MSTVTDPPNVHDPTTGPDRASAPTNYDVLTALFRKDQRLFALSLPPLATWIRDTAVLVKNWAAQALASQQAAATSAQSAAASANYQGDYSAATTYQVGESVSYNDDLFRAKTVNTGVTPVNGTNWFQSTDFVAADHVGNVAIDGALHATSMTDTLVTLTGATPDIDLTAGGEFEITVTANTTFSFSNPPANGRTTTKTLRISMSGGDFSLSFPTIETVNGAIIEPPLDGETKEFVLRARTSGGGVTTYILTEVGVLA